MIDEKSLAAYNPEDYPRIAVATDIVTLSISDEAVAGYREVPDKTFNVLLIKRGEMPFEGDWALPGGFVQPAETVRACAQRELHEETGVDRVYLEEIGTWSEVARDPRMRIVSVAHLALLNHQPMLHAQTDATQAAWFKISFVREKVTLYSDVACQQVREEVYTLTLESTDATLVATVQRRQSVEQGQYTESLTTLANTMIAFDHAEMIADAILKLRKHCVTSQATVFHLLPPKFTLKQLQQVHELIADMKLDAGNFRKRIKPFVIATEERDYSGSRKSILYEQNKESTFLNTL